MGGWHYLPIPAWISEELRQLEDRGVIAVRVTVGSTSWNTSLLPAGDGTHFVALNAKVRSANDLAVGRQVTLRFQTRDRQKTSLNLDPNTSQ